jgi:putative transposase
VKSARLPPRSPNLNAYAKPFVRSIKEPRLNRLILFGEESLRTAVYHFMALSCRAPHQGGQSTDPSRPMHLGKAGVVKHHQRLVACRRVMITGDDAPYSSAYRDNDRIE